MKLAWTDIAWKDYRYWTRNDPHVLRRVNDVISDALRTPFPGTGKPEPLVGEFAGWWSRRITGDHRLVYAVSGKGARQRLEIVACRYRHE